jgi:membrane protein
MAFYRVTNQGHEDPRRFISGTISHPTQIRVAILQRPISGIFFAAFTLWKIMHEQQTTLINMGKRYEPPYSQPPGSLRKKLYSLRSRLSRATSIVVERYYGDMLSLRAMSLTYSTLLSLVPFLAVTFSVLKAFGIQTRLGLLLAGALAPLGPERYEITQRIVEFVDNTQVGVLGALGIVGLFYTVISLVSNVEDAFNHIWRARRSSWAHRYREYIGVVLLGPVLIFAALALIASAQSYWLIQRLLEFEALGYILTLVTKVTPFLFLCAGFAFLYKVVPATRVKLQSAALGAVVAGVLWHIVGSGFAAFVASSAGYDAIYSGFAILIVFLLWLYLAWLIVLMGAEIAHLHQYAYLWSEIVPEHRHQHIFHERLALSALVEATRRFLAGEPAWKESELSARLRAPLNELEPILDRLVSRGLLLRSAQPEGISLARSPERISVTEVLEVLNGPLSSAGATENSVTQVLRHRESAVAQSLQGITLKSLAVESMPTVSKILKSSSG